MSILKHINNLWRAIGIFICLVIVMELLITSFFLVRSVFFPPIAARALADSYQDKSWVTDYYHEFRASNKFRWNPYTYWKREAYNGQYINVDEDGLRITHNTSIKYQAEYQIFVFGGSTAWGTGARDSYTIPSLLSEELSKNGESVYVTNFGESGYVSTQSLMMLISELKAGNIPDIVVFYDGINDSFSAYQQQVAGFPQNEFRRVNEFNLLNNKVISSKNDRLLLFSGFIQRTNTYRFAEWIIAQNGQRSSPKYSSDQIEDLSEDVVNNYEENIKILMALEQQYKFKAFAYWQPTIFSKPEHSNFEERVIENNQTLMMWFNAVYSEIKKAEDNQDFQDISHIFSSDSIGETPYFIDYGHTSENGNLIIAKRMSTDILVFLQTSKKQE